MVYYGEGGTVHTQHHTQHHTESVMENAQQTSGALRVGFVHFLSIIDAGTLFHTDWIFVDLCWNRQCQLILSHFNYIQRQRGARMCSTLSGTPYVNEFQLDISS